MAPGLSLAHWVSQEVSVHFPFNLSFSGKVFIEPFPCGPSENRLGAVSVIADFWALPGSEEPAASEEEEGLCVCNKLAHSSEATVSHGLHFQAWGG